MGVGSNTLLYGLLFISFCVSMYLIGRNKRLKQRIVSLERLCFDHGITKQRKHYQYALSSDDEYDELNPFITNSDVEKAATREEKKEYENIDSNHQNEDNGINESRSEDEQKLLQEC